MYNCSTMLSSSISSLDLLGSILDHLVLPPDIPGAQDPNIEVISQTVLTRLIHAVDTALDLADDVPWREAYQSLRSSLQACLELNRDHLERGSLFKHLKALDQGMVLILYLNEQNAGLLIRREDNDGDERVVFESFEASAVSHEVLAAGHAMQWDFPGRSASIKLDDFAEEAFQESLAVFLEQASMESLYCLQASTRKAGVSVGEIRDTTDPALITQMLMSLLEAIGSHYQAPVLRKRIRDDVNLTNTNIPWRRLPFWLILRVAAQRHLCFALGAQQGQVAYKFLIAILLAELLDDSAAALSPHKVVCLRTKLARRMVKLETTPEKIKLCGDVMHERWFNAASAVVRTSIEQANQKVEAVWNSFKRDTTRRILPLPHRAPSDSLKLTLPNSGAYLDNILSTRLLQTSAIGPITLPNPLDHGVQRSQAFTDSAFKLAALEQRIEQDAGRLSNGQQKHTDRCLELKREIQKVFDSVGSLYNSNPEQSSAMVLAIFTLWVELDQSAVAASALLADHAPVFHPELLDALQLPTKSGMERLQKIQMYLANRHAKSKYDNILEIHSRDPIALRCIADSQILQSLERRIQKDCDHAREKKKKEHTRSCNEYDEHTEGIEENRCRCTWEGTQRIVRGCTRCWHWRMCQRIKIKIQEAFLPRENPERGTIVFELGMDDWFSAYRDATWHILSELAHPHQPKSAKPEVLLKDCKPLQAYMNTQVGRLSLASKIKCFENTHYKFSQGRAPLSWVLLPFAADFRLYDSKLGLWVEDLARPPTLEHICGIQIPASLLSVLPKKLHPPTVVDGPSSYEIQANQAVVPKDVSVQAFSAYQKLLAGKRRRWPNLLVEMTSSNINLSDENTMRIICQLASQAGPRLPDETLRAVHEVFKYSVFTTRLATILGNMLESIRTNWREYNIMQIVITLTLRLFRLSGNSTGTAVLDAARKYLLGWISELQKEFRQAKDSIEAQRYANYGLHAALLCRETFAAYVETKRRLSEEDLSAWIQASIAVQENMLHDLSKLSDAQRNLLLRDAKMAYHLQDHIKSAMQANRSLVGAKILRDWSNPYVEAERASSSWTFLPGPQDRWIVTNTPGLIQETIHFNYIEGHLLVNGKPRSKLPLEIADDPAVKFIFRDQHLLTYPSRYPGMSHTLARRERDHLIFFGLRDGHAVIRATKFDFKSRVEETWEFVPHTNLGFLGRFDLPAELIQNCGHWLNINTRRLEIRRGSPDTPAFWKTRLSDWILDVPGRRAYRGEGGSLLVDPQSETFTQIAGIFSGFEKPDKLTVFQPQSFVGSLTVELKHLDLHFVVNQNKLLYCQQLSSEIDPDQDAGTWYGLRSKIVMRDINTQSRSIIVPLGKLLDVCRNGPHVDVSVQGDSVYARFKIDSTLGRLSCSPEPRLIYTKALYHAITSFCLPDTLTGRTGSSEAFTILQSGIAQPWTSVTRNGNEIFEEFGKLVPRREYHPPGVKRLQRVIWNPKLTSSIQCDGYRPLIEAIKIKSNNLEAFMIGSNFELVEPSHLCRRGRAQRKIYDSLLDVENSQEISEAIYKPRDRESSAKAGRVYQIGRVILSRCSRFYMGRTLRNILEPFKIIGGFSAPGTQQSASPLISQIEAPINENWGELVNFCRHGASKASVLFRLGLLAFNSKADMHSIHVLAAFCLVDEIRNLDPPQHQCFTNFPSCETLSIDLLEELMRPAYPKFQPIKGKRGKKLLVDVNNRVEIEHQKVCRNEGIELARRMKRYWPTPAYEITMDMLEPVPDGSESKGPALLIDVSLMWNNVKVEWQRRLANIELSNYITRVDKVLVSLCCVPDTATLEPWRTTEPDFISENSSFSYWSIVQEWNSKCGPVLEATERGLNDAIEEQSQHPPDSYSATEQQTELAELDRILQEFQQDSNDLRKQYAEDLRQSLAALRTLPHQPRTGVLASARGLKIVNAALKCAQDRVIAIWNAINIAFVVHDNRDPWLKLGAIRPISTKIELLTLLRSTASLSFGPEMKGAIVSYGVAITDTQRLLRIQHAICRSNNQALRDELRHVGHENWEPVRMPDWLLLEIDTDITIRAEQVTVAEAIINSKLGNRVLQLSMGKGKTSCIIPMVEAVLANGENLSRVIVPKSLIMQTAQTIQSRLGGLVGREVIHVPYSRRTSTEQQTLSLYADIHYEARRRHGIMLTCAEHLLSYKLFGWQKFIDSKKSTADYMIKFQKWLDTHCRDVLDECDFTLSIKTQLNYPSGPEMPVDFHPYRWQIVEELLGQVAGHLRELRGKHPRGIQVISRREGHYFPAVQFLRTEAEEALHDLIIHDVCLGRLMFLRPAHPTFRQKWNAIRKVLYASKISDELLGKVANCFSNPSIAVNALLLIRGLLLHRVIISCLGKRWNVQYGLHPDRDPIAVPYEAKGKPSEQAEYGHPDVAITFTCLSFYYAGLTQTQLAQGVQHILQSSDPAAQYEWWTSTCTELPASLRNWHVINVDDKGQMEKLWSFLGLNRVVINHFLNHFVFPVHARQFEVKLQACSWDIPIFSAEHTQKAQTTGFSGTNDNRFMLPLTISQRDLPQLQHTSAEVLSYLLQERNREFHVIADSRGQRLTEKDFLRHLKWNNVSVLIDVGAYISEMDNKEVAQAWLEVDTDAKATVYFASDNRAWVHYRSKNKVDVPLLATPFAEDLSGCNVFLDEGHTRGVDLRLPALAKGAVTLALKLTKDHVVQAAMRLRQLQTTQSIVFYGPPEVDRSIRDFCHMRLHGQINSSHVASWLLEQTCRFVEDLQGLYVAQGIDFCRRMDVVWHCKNFMKVPERQKLLRVLKQPERRTLRELYGPVSETSSISSGNDFASSQLRSFANELVLVSTDQQGKIQACALEEVEQEREVEAQIEQVRQVEKRVTYTALEFPGLHLDLLRFAKSGTLEPFDTKDPGFEHAFAFVGRTTVGKRFGVHETSSRLFVSKEFVNTVKVARDSQEGNNFLRPVEWIAWSPKTQAILVIIPEEAEHFMKVLRVTGSESCVHLIAYAAPVTKAMLHFNKLEFYSLPEIQEGQTIPERLRIELGILAGRLYVDQSEWEGVASYVKGPETGAAEDADRIATDPAAFLLEWLTIRRKTIDVLHTPMGYICTGREMENDGPSEEVDDA